MIRTCWYIIIKTK